MWVLWVDVAAAAAGLALLALVALSLYRRIKHFTAVLKQANSTLTSLTDELETAQRQKPLRQGPLNTP